MLGITIASSGGMLHQPSQDFTNWVRAGIGKLGDKAFGGRS
jgi:alanine racemase